MSDLHALLNLPPVIRQTTPLFAATLSMSALSSRRVQHDILFIRNVFRCRIDSACHSDLCESFSDAELYDINNESIFTHYFQMSTTDIKVRGFRYKFLPKPISTS